MVTDKRQHRLTHRRHIEAVAVAIAFVTCSPGAARAACSNLLGARPAPSDGARGSTARPVNTTDLLTLRDIGRPDGSDLSSPSPLAISPNGHEAAFIITQAAPETNSYCVGLAVIDLTGKAKPRLIDEGGEFIAIRNSLRGMLLDSGYPAVVTPVWSPDGTSIAYLRRDGGRTQVWLARSDGTGAHALTHSSVDVETLAWGGSAERLVFSTRSSLPAQDDALAKEGQSGWLYDDRFSPNIVAKPQRLDAPLAVYSIDANGSGLRKADTRERALVEEVVGDGLDGPTAMAGDGRTAVTRKAGPIDSLVLSVTDHGERIACEAESCSGGFTGIWWDADGKTLIYLRREGWARNEMGLYRWDALSGRAPKQILRTTGILLGCLPSKGTGPSSLACLSESATQPRKIVRIDTRNGRVQTLFDPNPQFAYFRFGKVERLHWTNALGLAAWADLVLPPDYRGQGKLPLIIVQYHSTGFLRGGTGDEYPIHALAAAGFAVLSMEADALDPKVLPGIRSWPELNARLVKDWTERRSQLSSLEIAVKMAVDRGIADPKRIGITGLSNGASAVRFALINSKVFSVAALSTCCMEQQAVDTYSGSRLTEDFSRQGYPAPGQEAGDFWKAYSLARNAKRIDQPILMQLADDEYLLAMEPYTALKAAGKPVEMYVYPGEHHIKWQPVHRAAIYQRNIDWFSFWLQDRIDPDPAKREQYRRWEALRAVAPNFGSE